MQNYLSASMRPPYARARGLSTHSLLDRDAVVSCWHLSLALALGLGLGLVGAHGAGSSAAGSGSGSGSKSPGLSLARNHSTCSADIVTARRTPLPGQSAATSSTR